MDPNIALRTEGSKRHSRFGTATHRDHFDRYRWTRQALGATGVLLGWTPVLRSAVRRKAALALARFSAA